MMTRTAMDSALSSMAIRSRGVTLPSFRELCRLSGIALVAVALLTLNPDDMSRDNCRPFTIGVSAIGGPDPIGGCGRSPWRRLFELGLKVKK
jgi:hypothetical protein